MQASTGDDPLAEEVSTIRQMLQSAVDAHDFAGAVVVVRRGGQTRTVAVGRADVAQHTPMRPDGRFRIGSVTKSMVAAVTLQLVAQGRLSLSDTVQSWEPGLLPRGDGITVADLLGQTSGLPDYTTSRAFVDAPGQPPTSPAALVSFVAHAPLLFKPGSRSSYSSTNYIVLGMILQKASHEPLSRLLQQRIFGPLGLHSASLAATQTMRPPLVHGYDHGKDVTSPDLTWAWAAGGVVSNAGDVARFYGDLLAGKVVHGPLLHRMLAQRRETNHQLPFSGYGLGVATLPTRCGPAYGHSGVVPGFLTHAWTTRNNQRSVVIAVNATLSPTVNYDVIHVLDQALCGA